MNSNGNGRRRRREAATVQDGERGLIWKLPRLKLQDVGKVGPAFGLGAGCGLGLGLGLIGGAGFGPGIPGLQVGFGFGAGCGIGLGFGYGVGRGIAYGEHHTYSNVGRLFGHRHLPVQDEIGALIDELVINTKKLAVAASREMDKWRR
ncbi:PREDICTED: uncharacterized protein LOC18592786 [Theobroma cacao]|uniref:Glycine-rich protein n=2 Tax=Theobroma cacao TaxID=3641 RepID=A0A061FR01_THECC|nr:PREDICTED: uncharacterized protein LOC18592786 [Theobroma cacao]EOY16964.1 Glycine-rich protein [Theobroma cacao]